ncbi:6454_t:CDS:10 [Diversispora eburnea]|uniref:6454_t:CDS:1 n=1 Tax=Diversispora eburnea TaxID=1213867 RepID=A0A9N8ZWN0_9GLOM|nr:6454_t:CDS:10 [Diversispora eburnea]
MASHTIINNKNNSEMKDKNQGTGSSSSDETLFTEEFEMQNGIVNPKEQRLRKEPFYTHTFASGSEHTNNKRNKRLEQHTEDQSNNENNENNDQTSAQIIHGFQRINYEFALLFFMVSIASYLIGYFGFTFVWIIFILYQAVMWYFNMVKDNTERLRWEIRREIAEDKLKTDEGETVEWLNYLLQQVWRIFDPVLLCGLRDMIEDAMSGCAPAIVRATDIGEFEIGLIAPRIEKYGIFFAPTLKDPITNLTKIYAYSIKILARRETEDDEDIVVGETTISFRAKSSTSTINDAPPHILAWIKSGISAIIPLKVELTGLKASVHFEIKITGSTPFVTAGRFSFLNFPDYEVGVMPLISMNIAQFPIFKQFMRNTVHTVLEEFTYPKYIDVDLAQFLVGDGLLHDTQAIGIMKVDVLQAKYLNKVDASGENDPYVLVSLDPSPHMSHPSTRVIENCANPVWSETLFIKIPQLDIVDEHVKLKLNVMDWDRFTQNDSIGAYWIDIKNAIGDGKEEKKIHDGYVDIHSKPNGGESRGKLRFLLSYYPKLPNDVKPSSSQTSGILGLQIHQAMSLQITAPPYSENKSDNHKSSKNPNPYAVVYINDSQDDPVIGIVTLTLKELFEKNEKKECSKWFTLRHGIGCGKVRLSFFYKTLSMKLSPKEKGYEVGTLMIHSIVALGLDMNLANSNIFLTLTLSGAEFKQTTSISNSNPPTWLNEADGEKQIRFGVLRRHRTALIIRLKQKKLFGIMYTIGTAILWLRDILDCREAEVEIPIFSGLTDVKVGGNHSHSDEASHNLSVLGEGAGPSEQNACAGPEEFEENDISSGDFPLPCDFRIDGELKGHLRLKVYFQSGLSISHEGNIKHTLTGANESVLYQNPFKNLHEINGDLDIEERGEPNGEIYDIEMPGEKRINEFRRRKTLRQMKWAKDLVGTKLTAMSGKREDKEIFEREL